MKFGKPSSWIWNKNQDIENFVIWKSSQKWKKNHEFENVHNICIKVCNLKNVHHFGKKVHKRIFKKTSQILKKFMNLGKVHEIHKINNK